jgi:transmembrane sensor
MLELFKKYIDNRCSPGELKLLLKEFDEGMNEEVLKNLIRQQLEANDEWLSSDTSGLEKLLEESFNKIKTRIESGNKNEIAPVVPITKRKWFRIAAAAVFILVVGTTFYLLNQSKKVQPAISKQQAQPDVAPGSNKAILTLANNSVVVLDSAQNGTLTQQGNAKVVKLTDGQLAYNSSNEKSTENLFNTITTPKSGQYKLILSDGTMVWLNAASSIRFPVSFTGNERKVEITGEAYFEVKHNDKMPFKVKINRTIGSGGEVLDVGTSFNINAYDDEGAVKTTLIEGAVTVSDNNTTMKLVPGQQSILDSRGELTLNKSVNTEEITAWKEGYFHFENADLKTVFRQVARWYDVDVVYEGPETNHTFFWVMKRSNSLKKVLEAMHDSNINYTIEGKKLIVRSK